MDFLDTQKRNREISRFIILIPHRDAGKLMAGYRQKLFAAGFPGAYSFPSVSPLAAVFRPLSREELKELALNIREQSRENDGKFLSMSTALVRLHDHQNIPGMGPVSFFGPLLNLPADEKIFPPAAEHKLLRTLLPPILCAALIGPDEETPREEAPVLSFRAAALANLSVRSLESGAKDYSHEWKISSPVWLPAWKRK